MKMHRTPRLHLRHKCTAYICWLFLLGIFFLPQCVFAEEKPKSNFHLQLSDVDNIPLDKPLMDAVERTDDDLLITSLYLGKILLRDDLLAYESQGNGDYFVPLQDIILALDLPITVNLDEGTAKGWFLDEKNIFDLSMKDASLKLGDKAIPLSSKNVELHEDGIFVSLTALAQWFPLTAEVDYNNLQITLKTLEPFPIEIKMARDQSRDRLGNKKSKTQELHELENIKAPFFTSPFVQVNSRSTYDNSSASQQLWREDYTLQASGQFLGQDTKFNINDIANDGNKSELRFTMGRKDPDKNLFGLGLSQYKLGDINTDYIPFLAKGNSGRGVSFSNKDLNSYSSSQSRTVVLRGDLPVGYQIDIVKDGQLVGFVEVPDENGEYAFETDVLTGLNVFEIVFYGPQGQKETKEERIFVPVNPIKKGDFKYTIGAIQDDADVFSNKKDPTNQDMGQDRLLAEAEYGLSENGSLYTAVATIPVEGERKDYGLLRYGYSFKGIRSDLSVVHSEHKGRGFGLGLQSVFKGIRWQAEHKVLYDFVSDQTLESGLRGSLRNDTSLAVSGLVPFIKNIPFSFNLERFENTEGQTLTNWRARLTNNIKKLRVTTQIDQRLQKDQRSMTDLNMQVSSRFQEINVRGTVVYGIQPESYLKNVNLTTDWRYNALTSFRGALHYTGGDSPIKTATVGVSHDFDSMKLGMSFSYNNRQEIVALLSSSFNLGRDSYKSRPYITKNDFSDSSLFVPRVFYDKNNNSVFDDEDQLLKDIGFVGTGIDKKPITNKQGLAYIPARPYERSSITIDSTTLPDPYLRVNVPQKDYILRPNQTVTKDFPIVMTGEFDSQVYAFRRGQKIEAPAIDIQVVSQDGKVIEKGKSEYDGFITVGGIPLGKYSVRLDPSQVETLGYCPVDAKPLELQLDNAAISVDSFMLWPQGKEGRKIVVLGQNLKQEDGLSLWEGLQENLSGLFLEKNNIPSAYFVEGAQKGLFDLVLYDVESTSAVQICNSLNMKGLACTVENHNQICPKNALEISQIDMKEEEEDNIHEVSPDLNANTIKDLNVKDIEKLLGGKKTEDEPAESE